MSYSVDVTKEYQKAKSKLFRSALVFSLVLAITIIIDVLLVILANENYIVNLIFAIIVTALFSYFAIFFFANIYPETNGQYQYFKGYNSGIQPIEEVEFLKKSDELCYINGLYVYPVYVRYSVGLNKIDKVIFAFSNDIDFEMGDDLTITTYQRILIKAEKHA